MAYKPCLCAPVIASLRTRLQPVLAFTRFNQRSLVYLTWVLTMPTMRTRVRDFMFYGLTDIQLRLQSVQNAVSRLITRTRGRERAHQFYA